MDKASKKSAYEVVAQYSGKDAGFIGMATTKDKAREMRNAQPMTARITRLLVSRDLYAQIVAAESAPQ